MARATTVTRRKVAETTGDTVVSVRRATRRSPTIRSAVSRTKRTAMGRNSVAKMNLSPVAAEDRTSMGAVVATTSRVDSRPAEAGPSGEVTHVVVASTADPPSLL